MPTNDPTAPRVVGDPSIPRDEVHFVVDGKTVGKIVGLDPAPRVVGGGDADALRKAFVDGYVKALGAEDDPWVRGHAELEAKEYPAVLPEDGRTPPKCEWVSPHDGQRCVKGAAHVNDPHPEVASHSVGPVAVHRSRDWWLARVDAEGATEVSAGAASPGGGAPTEGLSEGEAMALKYAIATLQSTIDPRWANLAPDVERGIAKHLAALESLASRLTRSPRAAGEPTPEQREALKHFAFRVALDICGKGLNEASRAAHYVGEYFEDGRLDGTDVGAAIMRVAAAFTSTAPPPERAPEGSSPHRPPQSEGDA